MYRFYNSDILYLSKYLKISIYLAYKCEIKVLTLSSVL